MFFVASSPHSIPSTALIFQGGEREKLDLDFSLLGAASAVVVIRSP